MRNILGCLPFLFPLALIQVTSQDSDAQRVQVSEAQLPELFYADLVVRGAVVGVETADVPVHEFEPTWDGPDGYFSVKTITFAVDEVIRGDADSTVTFCANTSVSTLNGRYEAGDEMIVCLLYRPQLYGGTYVVWSGNSRFVRGADDLWIAQGRGGHEVTLTEIRAMVMGTDIETVTRASGIIATGTVKNVRDYVIEPPNGASNKGKSHVWEVTLDADKVLKGAVVTGDLTFDVFRAGSYWPEWAHTAPGQPVVGRRYCVFLVEVDGRLRLTCGVNALFRLTSDEHLLHNDLPLPVTVEKIADLAQE